MKKIIIFGFGGHSNVVMEELILAKKYQIHAIFDTDKSKKSLQFKNKKIKIFHNLDKILEKNFPKSGIIAIGDNFNRLKIYKKIIKLNSKFNFINVISKSSLISKSVIIGTGNVILAKSFIGAKTVIKNQCIINSFSSIDHENFFDSFCSTGPGVITGGNVKLKKYSHLGIGCVIKNNITIGANTIIGGNSFVNKNCNDNSVYIGSPSKLLKKRKKNDKYL